MQGGGLYEPSIIGKECWIYILPTESNKNAPFSNGKCMITKWIKLVLLFLEKMSNKFSGNSAGRHGRVTRCVSCNNSANLMESFLKSIASPLTNLVFFHVTLTKRCSTFSPGFPCQFCLALMKLISEGNLFVSSSKMRSLFPFFAGFL